MKTNILRKLLSGLLVPAVAWANPQGMTVSKGPATAVSTGNQLTITAGNNAVLNWKSFNIGPKEITTFVQPTPSSVVWNRINDPNPSQIFGQLQANGIVVLMNQAGFYFGPNSMVKAAGLIATTCPVVPQDLAGGGAWSFSAPPPTASIVNYGQIEVGAGGSLFLIAEKVENHGVLMAPNGSLGLAAGDEVLLSERPDGRGLTAKVRLPRGMVENHGKIVADAGNIALQAQVINQDGLIQANSVRVQNGVVELLAGDQLNLGASSTITAHGDSAGVSPGGTVNLQSNGSFTDRSGSTVDLHGGPQGGDGGHLEISANRMQTIHSRLDAGAATGWSRGSLLLDPLDIYIAASVDGTTDNGTVLANTAPDTLLLNDTSAFSGFSQILLEARRDILVSGKWDLNASTGVSTPGSLLTLLAGRNIQMSTLSGIVAGDNWSVVMAAGVQFATGGGVAPGVGTISLQGSASIQSANGAISLAAGKDVSVGTGYIRTVGGGSISIAALSGSVNTGNDAGGFVFRTAGTGYDVNLATLGGVSTGAGGDVTISAGGDVTAYLPTLAGGTSDGGSGAFGSAPGSVTITAGGSVYGHFVLRNGVGSIKAGKNAGTPNQQLALSLVKGSWSVDAVAGGIALQEVRNPNGIFNNIGSDRAPTKHAFDYDPAASVSLIAAGAVQLVGAALPRNSLEQGIEPIYPPSLTIQAGGDIVVGQSLALFPSGVGQLSLTTTGTGSLRSATAGQPETFSMSDSGLTRYSKSTDFGPFDHAAVPVHLDDLTPVSINIAGDVRDLTLAMPKATTMTVGGNLVNTSFIGQNLRPSDTTQIIVAGDIQNRNDYTIVNLDQTPDFTLLQNAIQPGYADIGSLLQRFTYDPITHRLIFQSRMAATELQALTSLMDFTYDSLGFLVVDAAGQPVGTPVTFLPTSVLQQIYTDSQDIPSEPPAGYKVGGPGSFKIKARSVDLGVTEGIVSAGPSLNPSLAQYSVTGANIDLALSGDLAMFSSSIRTVSGGSISVYADGTINVGDPQVLGNSEIARGIYTATKADVTVVARGDVLVDGSRIAAYDGGNVFITSLEGSVDAGVGALGYVRVERDVVDPVTHQITTVLQPIPGSGILATSFPGTSDGLGDITVSAPAGDIQASQGGILQLSLNGSSTLGATISLTAGSRDADGKVTKVGNISAGGSGVIGTNVKLDATGDIEGLIVAQNNISLVAQQNVNVTAIASGGVSINAGGSVSGVVVGVGGISASGSTVDAALLGGTVATSGNVTSSQVGFSQVTVANNASQHSTQDSPTRESTPQVADSLDDDLKKKATRPVLARTAGRVTVILPQTGNNPK